MKGIITKFGPGLLIAATGVGAGDLATSALAGSHIGLVAISAVIIGGIFKYVLNEGLARWQLVTGSTLIDGVFSKLNPLIRYSFLIYLVLWSLTVAAALMSASGIAAHAVWPIFHDARTAKIVFGILLSGLGYVLVRLGGFKVFEQIMSVAIVLMVVAVLFTAFQLDYQFNTDHLRFMPIDSVSWEWYVAVLGGVGGTVTILCYGYWLREQGREGENQLGTSRIDLGVAYGLTVVLGLAMVLIGSQLNLQGKGASLLVQIAETLTHQTNPVIGWVFRLGAFAAIFSSLLGVWQSVPYLFTDLLTSSKLKNVVNDYTGKKVYKYYLLGISTIPIIGLWWGFSNVQKLYAICGALFIPMLALTLLIVSVSADSIAKFKSRWFTVVLYALVLIFFLISLTKLII